MKRIGKIFVRAHNILNGKLIFLEGFIGGKCFLRCFFYLFQGKKKGAKIFVPTKNKKEKKRIATTTAKIENEKTKNMVGEIGINSLQTFEYTKDIEAFSGTPLYTYIC